MEINQLHSEVLAARTAETAQQLYTQMASTSLDFRTLGVPEDWLDQLWDLAQDVRKLIPESVALREDDRSQLFSDMLPHLERMGVKMKSPAKLSRESRQKEAELERLRKRLQQIRQNAWFDIKIAPVNIDLYHSERAEQSAILESRLRLLQTMLPTSVETSLVTRNYLETMTLWQTLDRPSTLEERRKGMDSLTQSRLLVQRTKRFFNERDQVIFLWKDPVIEPDPAEEDEIRADIMQTLQKMGVEREDI